MAITAIRMTPQQVENAVSGNDPRFINCTELPMFRWGNNQLKHCFILWGVEGKTFMAHSVLSFSGTVREGTYKREFFPDVTEVELRGNDWYAVNNAKEAK